MIPDNLTQRRSSRKNDGMDKCNNTSNPLPLYHNSSSKLGDVFKETRQTQAPSYSTQLQHGVYEGANPRSEVYKGIRDQARTFLAYLAFQEAAASNRQFEHEVYVPLPIFDGTGDPVEFLRILCEGLRRMNVDPEEEKSGYQRLFLGCLRGDARRWSKSASLDTRPPEELQWMFLKRYASQDKEHVATPGVRAEIRHPPKNTRKEGDYDRKKSENKLVGYPKVKTYSTKRSEKDNLPWCNHHKRSGHRTEVCRELQGRLVAAYKESLFRRTLNPDEHRDSWEPAKILESGQLSDNYLRSRPRSPPILINQVNTIAATKGQVNHLPDQTSQSAGDFQKELVFTASDLEGVEVPHSDLLVVTLRIADQLVPHILVDTGSSSDIISIETLQRIWAKDMKINPRTKTLSSFGGECVPIVGSVKLPISVGGTLRIIEFEVIEKGMIYNAILGTPWLFSMKAVASTFHQCLKFPTSEGIYTVRGSQVESRRCLTLDRVFHPLKNSKHLEHDRQTSEYIPVEVAKTSEEPTAKDNTCSEKRPEKRLRP